jgi:hypothetical protein
MGYVAFLAGSAGSAGGSGAGAVGSALTPPVTGCISIGGTGGGGCTTTEFAGGNLNVTSPSVIAQFKPVITTAAGQNGSNGINLEKPYGFFAYPGLGGHSNNAGTGGTGGSGGVSCGGGGGGGGVTGGKGGNGGDGMIILIAY